MQLQHKKIRQQYFPFLLRTSRLLYSELRDQYRDDCFKGHLIIWNNKDITIEGKSLYWKTWSERGPYFVQDLLKNTQNTGKYLSLEEFKTKYYCQILSAIPKNLKLKAMTIKRPPGTLVEESDVYQSPDSLEHTFLVCSVAEDFFCEMMTWFNNEQKSQINMTKQQILFSDFTLPIGSQHLLK